MVDTRSTVKALYIYTFATLVEWPTSKRSGDFVIGVYGSQVAVYNELIKKYSGKSIGSQKIVISKFKSKAAITNCHILFVCEENTADISSLASTYAKESTLIVGERVGALSKGAIINFIVDGNQQKYEINKTNAKNHDLVITNKLSDLAISVTK